MCAYLSHAHYWPATQACALTGNRICDPLVHRPALNPLSHTSQGSLLAFKIFSLPLKLQHDVLKYVFIFLYPAGSCSTLLIWEFESSFNPFQYSFSIIPSIFLFENLIRYMLQFLSLPFISHNWSSTLIKKICQCCVLGEHFINIFHSLVLLSSCPIYSLIVCHMCFSFNDCIFNFQDF